ncbi:MAG: hypothetical protein EOR16_16360 [Mesorhizobium sp.]|uniref:hypothetical protein n=1 Tax=Mesorhizobium sp. TaxID=1871066 RepID=UPI000FE47C91|nr:hypothetical protein [Mesorhizobium sp.]RWI57145.1 MAG: hypothetical protein EOR16_16360 [Mesorhizobium sp.]
MSASLIFDLAPLGAIVKYSDGTPRPPEHYRKKLAAWKNRNNGGRLIAKRPRRVVGSTTILESFTLHEGDFGSGGVVVLRVHRSFSIDSNLKFTVVERPAIGSVVVLDRPDGELVHLAENHAAAETWLKSHGYPHAMLQPVTADQVAADVVEGRAAA